MSLTDTPTDQQARLAALYEVSTQLGTTLDLPILLNLVMDSIIKLTKAERGFLILIENLTSDLQPVAARNMDQESITGRAMQISRTIVERAIRTDAAILTDNAQEDNRFSAHQSVIGYQLRSIMCAPMRARGRVIGAAYVDNRLFSGVFSAKDLDLLVAFINQAAIAIDNARLFQQTDQALARRVEELTLFQQIDQELNKSLDLNRVLSLALQWAIKLTASDGGSLGLLVKEEEKELLRLLVHQGAADPRHELVSIHHPILQKALQDRLPVLNQNMGDELAIDGSKANSQLVVPIKREGRVIGIISLESQTTTAYTTEDIAFAIRLADRAAVAIENARLYEAVQAAHKSKTDFISVVTHELRLPMTSIKGYTDLVRREMVGMLNPQQKEFLEIVHRNVDRMNVLIEDLSNINRMESGRMKFELAPFDMKQVITDVVSNLRERIESKQQRLTFTIDPELPTVFADRTRISQVLTNLVSNAHKYTNSNGHIQIVTNPQNQVVLVSVIDNGIGIAAEELNRLFQQFVRSSDPLVREQTGWGLGLSIVKMMVEAQGGQVGVSSEYRQGSTFWFTVPIAQSARTNNEHN